MAAFQIQRYTFTLTYSGQTTADIAYNASVAGYINYVILDER